MSWVEITCQEADRILRTNNLTVSVGRTDVEAGLFYREWVDADGCDVLKDEKANDDCHHHRWNAMSDTTCGDPFLSPSQTNPTAGTPEDAAVQLDMARDLDRALKAREGDDSR